MIVAYRKRFLKELAKIPTSPRSRIEKLVFETFPNADSIHDIGVIEQMKGYPSFYKVRFGSYRIGLRIEKDKAVFERALHRRDIYRHFP
jgi:mRNA interferase RelE/StbE